MRSPVSPSTKWMLWSYAPNTTHVRPSRSNTAGCPVHPLPHHVRLTPPSLEGPHIAASGKLHTTLACVGHRAAAVVAPGRVPAERQQARRPRSPTVVRTKRDRRRGRCAVRPAPGSSSRVRPRSSRSRAPMRRRDPRPTSPARPSSSPSLPLVARMSTPMPMKPISTSVRTSRRCRARARACSGADTVRRYPARTAGGGNAQQRASRLVVGLWPRSECARASAARRTGPRRDRSSTVRSAGSASTRPSSRSRGRSRRTVTTSSPRTAACSRSATPRSTARSAGCA